jgi:hypothetical protein
LWSSDVGEKLRVLDPAKHFESEFEIFQLVLDLTGADPVDTEVFDKDDGQFLKYRLEIPDVESIRVIDL